MNLFKTFHNPDAQVGSSAFDLSAKHVFSAKAGQVKPAYVLDTVPGDKFEIDLAAMMRSNTMDTAAFVRGKFNFDFFFVPYQQVWHRFLDFVSMHRDLHTSLYSSLDVVSAPCFSMKQLIRNIVNLGTNNVNADVVTHYWHNPAFDMLSLLDMLGYGNYTWLLQKAIDGSWAVDDDLLASDLHKLFGDGGEILGISDPGVVYCNPFRLCAYQHIWYDFYRNKYHDTEVNETGRLYQSYFNLDDINCSSIGLARNSIEMSRMLNICSMRYCQWKKDIYTACMPTQQYGVVSSVDVGLSKFLNSSGVSPNGKVDVISFNGQPYFSSALTDGQAPSTWASSIATQKGSFDILSLRRAEALQAWREAALRAGNMNDANQKAHFGVDPYYYEDNQVRFLGSFDGSFQVNPVEATAQTGAATNGEVGALAATGTAVANGSKLHFDCRDYGVLMCIARFVPESEYSSNGIERSNSRFEPYDYYSPEFANLGLQAVPMIENELSIYWMNRNFVLGYAPRDYDYKQMVDKVYGLFGSHLNYDGTRSYGVASNWVTPRVENLVSAENHVAQYRRTTSFYVDPRIFDRVFGLSANSNPNTDQFFFNAFFDVKAIRKMPILGLPQF